MGLPSDSESEHEEQNSQDNKYEVQDDLFEKESNDKWIN